MDMESEASIEATSQRQLRDRTMLRPVIPVSLEDVQLDKIRNLKRQRAGKKASITKLMTVIRKLITDRGSRTKLRFLQQELYTKLKSAADIHEQLMTLFDESSPEFNDEWIAELAVVVDTCSGDVSAYLDERGDDSSSDSTFASSLFKSSSERYERDLSQSHGLSASAQNVADVSRRFANFRISGANSEHRSVKSEPVGFTESQAEGTLPAQVQSRRTTEFHLSQENVVMNGNWDISSTNAGNRRRISMAPQCLKTRTILNLGL